MLLHVGAFHLDLDSHHSTLWHRLAVRTRVLCTLLFVFATALTPNGQWWTWAIYATGLLSLIGLSRVTVFELLRRVAVEFVFLGVVLLGTLFRDGGDVVWQWGWVTITTTGMTVLGSVSVKTLLCLSMLNVLILTTPIPSLLHGLRQLKVPPLLVAILAAMYRYVGVLVTELATMRRAAMARNLLGHRRWHRLVIGNMIGALFVRTYERGDRIHQAMLSRGYTGLPPNTVEVLSGRRDRTAITLTFLLLCGGQAIYLGI